MKYRYIVLLLIISIFYIVPLYSEHVDAGVQRIANEEQYPPVFTNASSVAIKGYDTVAYFTQKKAVKGKKAYQSEYIGATWYFSSQQHLELFMEDPSKYVPQYGGYCAYAMAQDYLAPIDVKAWTVYKGKLYLNFSTSVKRKWEKKKDVYITQADNNWKKRISQNLQ